ncbi:hypothetical protein FDUTEX481_05907 [Tolypothrix sp. PCC 7601]|nr:hypothetical protein FDUTEX481_05907 [Tolypothrix sp. PCC 7601]
MWGGHLVRPAYVAGKIPAPQDGIIYFLEIPYISLGMDIFIHAPCFLMFAFPASN